MKHSRPDYSHLQDPTNAIPRDEPVFLIRGQDPCAGDTVRAWAAAAEARGADPAMIQMARDHARAMDEWPKKKQRPDL